MSRFWRYILLLAVVLCIAVLGASFYMLDFALARRHTAWTEEQATCMEVYDIQAFFSHLFKEARNVFFFFVPIPHRVEKEAS